MSPRAPNYSVSDVRRSILVIEKQGNKPSIRTVREFLGGGSTALINQILNDEAALKERAISLAKKISAKNLVEVITNEVTDSMGEGGRERAEASLAGCLGEHFPPKKSSFRDYVKDGLGLLAGMSESAIDKIEEIQFKREPFEEDLSRRELDHILWIRAYACAADAADIGEVAVLLGEDWIDLNELLDDE